MTKEMLLNMISWVMLYALASLAVPVLPAIGPVYYIALIGMAVFALFRRQETWDLRLVLVLLACILSIVLNNPPALFKSWERFALFFIMLVVVAPLCQNVRIDTFRLKLFNGVIGLLIAVTAISCIAYFGGIDLTVRTPGVVTLFFGGIAGNSMLLAVCAGVSFVCLLNRLLNLQYPEEHRTIYIAGTIILMVASFICLLVSGSRGATLSTVVSILFLFYKRNVGHISRFLIYITVFCALAVASYSLWEPYTKPLIEKQKGNTNTGSMTASRDSKWEARIDEFLSSPAFGIGFSAVDLKYKEDYLKNGGVVETGTSWGGMLSMVGLLGFLPFLWLYVDLLWFLFWDNYSLYYSGLLAVVVCWFSVHMVVEGYILAGGSFLCFILWLTMGATSAYRAQAMEKKKEVENEKTV